MFGNLGFSETVVILGIALILFGPRRLPEIGRVLGKAMAQFRRAATDLRETVEREVQASELKDAAVRVKEAGDVVQRSVWQAIELAPPLAAGPAPGDPGAAATAPAIPATEMTATTEVAAMSEATAASEATPGPSAPPPAPGEPSRS